MAPDTITFLINHFPSRRFGKESEICRLYVAAQARKITDSLLAKNAFSKIVIMGDLNDEPNSESILSTLKAASSPDSLKPGRLLNVMGPLKAKGLGTYYFRGEFNMLDNLIISKGLLEPKSKFGLRYEANSAAVYKSDKIVEASGQYKGAPFRTYAGPNYKGGYSDHFPVFMQLSE